MSDGEYFRKAAFKGVFLGDETSRPPKLNGFHSFALGVGWIIVKKTVHPKAHGRTEIGEVTFSLCEE